MIQTLNSSSLRQGHLDGITWAVRDFLLAVQYNDIETVERLLQEEYIPDVHQEEAVQIASSRHNPEMLQLLLASKPRLTSEV